MYYSPQETRNRIGSKIMQLGVDMKCMQLRKPSLVGVASPVIVHGVKKWNELKRFMQTVYEMRCTCAQSIITCPIIVVASKSYLYFVLIRSAALRNTAALQDKNKAMNNDMTISVPMFKRHVVPVLSCL